MVEAGLLGRKSGRGFHRYETLTVATGYHPPVERHHQRPGRRRPRRGAGPGPPPRHIDSRRRRRRARRASVASPRRSSSRPTASATPRRRRAIGPPERSQVPVEVRRAFGRCVSDGWAGLACAAEHGGGGFPSVVGLAAEEMFASANLALSLNPMLTQGAVHLLERWGSPSSSARRYLPELVSGEWTGTMNLTEPDAGSDVGAVRTSARPLGDGRWAITGTKIFITWGEHDLYGEHRPPRARPDARRAGGHQGHLAVRRAPSLSTPDGRCATACAASASSTSSASTPAPPACSSSTAPSASWSVPKARAWPRCSR